MHFKHWFFQNRSDFADLPLRCVHFTIFDAFKNTQGEDFRPQTSQNIRQIDAWEFFGLSNRMKQF